MKLRGAEIFIFCVLFLLFGGLQINAQLCGKYKVTIEVLDENDKPINNAVVQFLPITKDETRGKQFVREENDLSKFSVEYFEGQSISKFHKLIVSADGYKAAENRDKIYPPATDY